MSAPLTGLYLAPSILRLKLFAKDELFEYLYYFQWGIRHRGKAKTAAVFSSDDFNNIKTFFFREYECFRKGQIVCFLAFPRQSEVKLEMILQLTLYIIKTNSQPLPQDCISFILQYQFGIKT